VSGIFGGKPQGSIFAAAGYTWLISYTGGDGNDVTVTTQASLTPIEQWRFQYFGTSANSGNSADSFDANKDGESNLLEFSTGQNPHAATKAVTSVVKNGATIEFTYPRSNAAMADGVIFAVEWSDSLATGSWSSAGVTEQILTDNGTVQNVKVSAPAGVNRRFMRLNVIK
jgi:hypothetical protein